MNDFKALLQALANHSVEFILVGGVAATALGASRLTEDLDILYRRSPENIARLVAALAPLRPYLRGLPVGLPFQFDMATVSRGMNFTLVTNIGAIDLLAELTGGGSYENLLPTSASILVFGVSCRCLTINALIQTKRAVGRPKDLQAIAELEMIRDERKPGGST